MTLSRGPRPSLPPPSTRRHPPGIPLQTPSGRASLLDRRSLRLLDPWRWNGCSSRHDQRFFELVEDTIGEEFEYWYLLLQPTRSASPSVQPIFVYPQFLLDGASGCLSTLTQRLHRAAPKLLTLRTLMVGSPVGEGALAASEDGAALYAQTLADALPAAARHLRAPLIVLKEFPAELRPALTVFQDSGYARIPSMPYVSLDLAFRNFDDHMTRSLSASVRKDLRRKFRDSAAAPPIRMEVITDISERIPDLYPLYLQVYERAKLRFEKLTPEYLCRLGRDFPDRARFFIWTQEGRPIAFNACTLHDDVLWADYLGMDYRVALDLHLYFIVTRDEIDWCCRNGIRRYCSTSLNYDPKLHLRFRLLPLDLYIRHTNAWVNFILRRMVPWMTPAKHDGLLRRFPNAHEM